MTDARSVIVLASALLALIGAPAASAGAGPRLLESEAIQRFVASHDPSTRQAGLDAQVARYAQRRTGAH
jgi:hypothetical protein